MNQQPFVQLNGAHRPQGQSPPPHQGGFVHAGMNRARPTPPPGPPMAQMPPVNPGGHPRQGHNFRGRSYTPPSGDRIGPYGPPSPASIGSGRSLNRQGHPGRRSRPVIHNALERRSPPRKEVYDLRSKVTSEKEARDALSTYVVWSIKKDGNDTGYDDNGFPVVPTWQRATHFHDTGVSQEEAGRRVWELQCDGSVSKKKDKLATVIQDQLEYSQDQLEEREEDPRFCYQLVQLHQSVKRVDQSPHFAEQYIEDSRRGSSSRRSRSGDRHSSKDKKKRDKYKKSLYLYEAPKYKKPKHKKDKRTESITAYYRRVPREHINCLQMWEDLQEGYDSWDSANSSPQFSMQQPFVSMGQQPHHGVHQGSHMPMNMPHVNEGFPPPNTFGMPQQGGLPPHQPFSQGGQQGPGLNQHVPHMQQQGFQPHQQQQGIHNQQVFPQQAQYAQGQGPNNVPYPGQLGGAQGFGPGAQHGQHGLHQQNGQHHQARPGQPGGATGFGPGAQHGRQGFQPQNGQLPQGRPGQPGGHPPFSQDFRGGPQPQHKQVPVNGQRTDQTDRAHAPNQGFQHSMAQGRFQPGQKPNMAPPPPPSHAQPGRHGNIKPRRVYPLSASPRSTATSFAGTDDDSGSDSGVDTPASSVTSDGRRGRPRHKSTRSRSRSQSHIPKAEWYSAREHSRAGAPRHARSVSPCTVRPRSAMRNTSRPDSGRCSPWQKDFRSSGTRRVVDEFDQDPTSSRMNGFDRDMLGRKMHGNFNRESPPRRAYSDDFFDHRPQRTAMSDYDRPMPRRRVGSGLDDPRSGRGGIGRGFRGVSPFTARRPMFEDDMEVLSDDFEGLRFNKGFSADNRRHFHGGDQLGKGFRDRFRSPEYEDEGEEYKRTRFADGAPGWDYARPMGRSFVNYGPRPFGPRRAESTYVG